MNQAIIMTGNNVAMLLSWLKNNKCKLIPLWYFECDIWFERGAESG